MSDRISKDVNARIAATLRALCSHVEALARDFNVNGYRDSDTGTEFYKDGIPSFGFSAQLEQDSVASNPT